MQFIRALKRKNTCPKLLLSSPPLSCLQFSLADGARFGGSCLIHGPPLPPLPLHTECEDLSVSGEAGIEEVKSPVLRSPPAFSHSRCPPEIHKSCICVRFIAEHTKMLEDSTKVILKSLLLIKSNETWIAIVTMITNYSRKKKRKNIVGEESRIPCMKRHAWI